MNQSKVMLISEFHSCSGDLICHLCQGRVYPNSSSSLMVVFIMSTYVRKYINHFYTYLPINTTKLLNRKPAQTMVKYGMSYKWKKLTNRQKQYIICSDVILVLSSSYFLIINNLLLVRRKYNKQQSFIFFLRGSEDVFVRLYYLFWGLAGWLTMVWSDVTSSNCSLLLEAWLDCGHQPGNRCCYSGSLSTSILYRHRREAREAATIQKPDPACINKTL